MLSVTLTSPAKVKSAVPEIVAPVVAHPASIETADAVTAFATENSEADLTESEEIVNGVAVVVTPPEMVKLLKDAILDDGKVFVAVNSTVPPKV